MSRLSRLTSFYTSIFLCGGVLLSWASVAENEVAPAESTTESVSSISPEAEPVIDIVSLTAVCVACHGDDGNALIPEYPNLAGQNEKYLLHQLRQIRSGERVIPLMVGQIDNMSDAELQAMATYYASMPGKIGQATPDNLDLGEAIYRGGIIAKGVAACTACHAPNGNGNYLAGFPRIAGQNVEFTVTALREYREGMRESDENFGGMMRDIAAGLTDTEMAAVANYIKGLY